jgi:predicted chitinase
VTLLVNGGQTAIDERTEFTKKIKEVFKYDSCKNKK